MQVDVILALILLHSNHDREDLNSDNVSLEVALDSCVCKAKNIFQVYTNRKMLQVFNTNDDYSNNDSKYPQQSRKQYDVSLLLICDDPKNDDEKSSDVTINSIIARRDTNHNICMVYIQSVCYSTIDHGTVSIKVLYKRTFQVMFQYCLLVSRSVLILLFVW